MKRELGRDAALLIGAQVYYKVTGGLVYPLLSWALLPREVGLYFFAISLCQVSLVAAHWNLQPLVIRRLVAAGGAPAAARELAPLVGFRLVTSPLFVIGSAALGAALRPGHAGAFAVTAVFVLLEDLYGICAGTLMALDEVRQVVTLGVVVQTTYLGALVLGLELRPALSTVLAVSLLRTVLVCGGGIAILGRIIGRVRPVLTSAVFRGLTPFFLLAAGQVVIDQVDTLILGGWVDLARIGHYNLGLRTVQAAQFVPIVLGGLHYSRFSGRLPDAAVRALTVRTLLGLAALGAAGAAAQYLGADLIARLLFPGVRAPAAAALRQLAPTLALGFVQLYLAALLQMFGRERAALGALGAGALLGIGLDLALVPRHGVAGAAAARAASLAAQLAVSAFVLTRVWRDARQAAP